MPQENGVSPFEQHAFEQHAPRSTRLYGSLRSADPPPTRIPAKSGEINRLVWLMYRYRG